MSIIFRNATERVASRALDFRGGLAIYCSRLTEAPNNDGDD